MTQRELALEVLTKLRAAGHDALWAGGCVRDQLLGREPKDYDVATSARPEQVRELFGQRRTLDELTEDLILSAGDTTAKRSAFWTMLTLSAVIAAGGVLTDSTATVIGAMIIAPLSTPIMGIALGSVQRRRTGSITVVLLACLLDCRTNNFSSYRMHHAVDIDGNHLCGCTLRLRRERECDRENGSVSQPAFTIAPSLDAEGCGTIHDI